MHTTRVISVATSFRVSAKLRQSYNQCYSLGIISAKWWFFRWDTLLQATVGFKPFCIGQYTSLQSKKLTGKLRYLCLADCTLRGRIDSRPVSPLECLWFVSLVASTAPPESLQFDLNSLLILHRRPLECHARSTKNQKLDLSYCSLRPHLTTFLHHFFFLLSSGRSWSTFLFLHIATSVFDNWRSGRIRRRITWFSLLFLLLSFFALYRFVA